MPEQANSLGAFTLDASQPNPPTIPTGTYYEDTKEFLAGGVWIDFLTMPHFTTNPDPAAWPSGAIWPPHPPNPIGNYVYPKQYSNTPITLRSDAWAALRRRSSVYAFLLSGPRTIVPIGAKYDVLLRVWRKGVSTYLPIVHHNPVASAGQSAVWPVTSDGGLRADLTLNGSGSFDPDEDPLLSYTWTIIGAPVGASKLPWRPLVGPVVAALPAGTAIPVDALGVYTFRLTVTDAFGSSTADVVHSLLRVNSGPIADAGPPFSVYRLLTGRRAKEAVIVDASGSRDPDGDPLTYVWRQVPPANPVEVPLLATPVTSSSPRLTLAQQGQKIAPSILAATMEVTVRDPVGAAASDRITVGFEIVHADVALGQGDREAVALEDLAENGLLIPVTITPPNDPTDLVEPDGWTLRIWDANSTSTRGYARPVTDDEIANGVRWDGTLGPGTIPRPGRFRLRLDASTEGAFYFQSEPHDVEVIAVEVSLTGPTQPSILAGNSTGSGAGGSGGTGLGPSGGPGSGGSTGGGGPGPFGGPFGGPILEAGGTTPTVTMDAFPIRASGPTMPALTITATVHGLTASQTAALSTDMRLEFEWKLDGQQQRARYPADEWHTVPVGQTQWTVTPTQFAGGVVTARARITHLGVTVTGESQTKTPVLAANPSAAEARSTIGSDTLRAVAYETSRFRQFGSDAPSIAEVVLTTPYTRGGRCGLGGTKDASAEQQWSWRANVTDLRSRARQAATAALDEEQGAAATAGRSAVGLGADEMAREIWTRLDNPAAGYHTFDASSRQWVRRPATDGAAAARDHADRLAFLSATVQAGRPPRDWTTAPDTGSDARATLSQTPEGFIREILGSGGPIATAIDSAYAVLTPLPWWNLHATLDALAGPGTGPVIIGPLDVLAEGAPGQVRDPRVTAAIEAARLRRGPRLFTDADLPRLERFVDALIALNPIDRQLALQSLGLPALAAEGISAVIDSGDGYPDALGAASLATTPAPPTGARTRVNSGDTSSPRAAPPPTGGSVPFGSWNKPGNMPAAYYIGSAVHFAIGALYERIHGPHAAYVATNVTTVTSILTKLAKNYPLDPIEVVDAILKPDIIEDSINHFPPVIAYEIKPRGSEDLGEEQLRRYLAALALGNVPCGAGPKYLPGTYGIVPAPDGWAEFNTPRDGVITYKVFKASREQVEERARKEGRKPEGSTVRRALEAIGWGLLAALVAWLILQALVALAGLILAVLAFA